MSMSVLSDMKIYDEQFQAGVYEAVTQNLMAFNASSRGALQLVSKALLGEYNKQSFWKQVADVMARRDMTSVSTVTAKVMAQDEVVGVKCQRRFGPIDATLGALAAVASDEREMSFLLGRAFGEEKLKTQLNTGLLAIEAAIEHVGADLTYSGNLAGTTTLCQDSLAAGLAMLGDRAERVVCWVMHSKPFWNLIRNTISDKVSGIADTIVYGGMPPTLGRPVVVTDSESLHDANGTGTDTYNVLGLVAGALTVTESEQDRVIGEFVTGYEQLAWRVQGETAFNVNVKGFKWDVTNGGGNPTDASIATTTNWDQVATSYKDCAGVRIIVQ